MRAALAVFVASQVVVVGLIAVQAVRLWMLSRSERARGQDVDAAAKHRSQEEWNARKRRSEWARAHRAHQQAQDRLRLFRSRNGGTPAA